MYRAHCAVIFAMAQLSCFYSAIKRLSILCYIKSVCSLFILPCLAFSSPRFLVPYFPFLHYHFLHFCATFSSLAFSSPAVLCRVFHSCIFQPCIFLCAAFSCPAFSVAIYVIWNANYAIMNQFVFFQCSV